MAFSMQIPEKGRGPFQAEFRFYEELNDFLPPALRKISFIVHFKGNPAVKDTIESLGVPHTEVDVILVNGSPQGFGYPLGDRDRVAVYPVFESLDIGSVNRLRKEPLRKTAFIADSGLGKLARLLRMTGFDTLYRNDYEDPDVVSIARSEKRMILTRDQGLLKRNAVMHGYWVRHTDPWDQLLEVFRRFDLRGRIRPFTRCLLCNGPVEPAAKEKVLDRLPPRTRRYYNRFYQCRDCHQVYWKGSHYRRMQERIGGLEAGGDR